MIKYFMQIVSFSELRKNPKQIFDQTTDQYESVIIKRSHDYNIVMLPLESYESLKETAYLLSQAANAKHLRASIANAKKGNFIIE